MLIYIETQTDTVLKSRKICIKNLLNEIIVLSSRIKLEASEPRMIPNQNYIYPNEDYILNLPHQTFVFEVATIICFRKYIELYSISDNLNKLLVDY